MAGTDTRELIMARLFEIFSAIDDFKTVVRDRGELEDQFLPACLLLDGDETSSETDSPMREKHHFGRGHGRPVIARMAPEIFVQLPSEILPNQSRGQMLNALRAKMVKGVMLDSTLSDLVGPNGQLSYQGVLTDLARGRGMRGMMQLHIIVSYVFKVTDL